MTELLAGLGWLLVVGLPGCAVSGALWPNAGAGRIVALAAPIGVGTTMASGQLLQACGAAVEPATVLPLSLGVPAVLFAATTRYRLARNRTPSRPSARSTGVPGALVFASMVAGLLLWAAAIPSPSALVPNIDGANHGLFVSRIVRLSTIDPRVVTAGDLATGEPHPSYYPLGVHLSAALVNRITGVAGSTVLTTGVVLSAAIVLPLGTFVLARRFVPPTTAGVAAVLATTLPWFPYSPMVWGGVPLLVAMSQVPACVDAAWVGPGTQLAWSRGAVLALAGYGLFEEHNSELATALLFIAVLVATTFRHYDGRQRRQIARTYALAGASFLLLVVPDAQELLAGADERAANLGNKLVSGNPVVLFLGAANPVVLVLAVLGVVVAVRAGVALGWLACGVVIALVYAASFLPSAVSHPLTFPWYASSARVSYAFSYFEVAFGAIGVVALGRAAGRLRASGSRPVAVRFAAAAAGLAFLLVTVLPSFSAARFAYRDESPVSGPQRAAFAWLATHVRAGERVLNDFVDGSGWMETLDGVAPVFATYPNPQPGIAPQVAWGDRWYLFVHAAQLATDRRAQAAARRWHVTYAYVGGRTMHPFVARLTVAALSRSPSYRLVWRCGAAAIFRIVLPAPPGGAGE